jgi:hypothetical protein
VQRINAAVRFRIGGTGTLAIPIIPLFNTLKNETIFEIVKVANFDFCKKKIEEIETSWTQDGRRFLTFKHIKNKILMT